MAQQNTPTDPQTKARKNSPVSPKVKPKQTTTEKKLNIVEKTARLMKESLANLEPTSFQTQQHRACGSQALTRTDDSSSSS
ncbi:10280_t:CDS:2 [Acaulospora colombiana]|uniref:10280_t:CDS:1 n=1 Tax=Acaulospora colombiana TaxID=27376 RepID=A0ACA9LGR0_9GLOM|nr:10280_t:CDS:2 [Acaulospora colombiana]